MQLMGMPNTEEWYDEGAALPLLFSLSLAYRDVKGVKCSRSSQEERRSSLLPPLMTWLCDKGIMTSSLASFCFPLQQANAVEKTVKQEDRRRWILTRGEARGHIPPEALGVLQRWEQQGGEKQWKLSRAALNK